MEDNLVRSALDSMGVEWDDPVRTEAMEFARRDTDAKLLWLFVNIRRESQNREKERSRMPTALERLMVGASGGGVVLLGFIAQSMGVDRWVKIIMGVHE